MSSSAPCRVRSAQIQQHCCIHFRLCRFTLQTYHTSTYTEAFDLRPRLSALRHLKEATLLTRIGFVLGLLIAGDFDMALAQTRTITLPGTAASASSHWQPALMVREQTSANADRKQPVLYVHGGTFPSANSMMFKFDGISWADAMNAAGLSVWALDFAGFGSSEFYPEMAEATPLGGQPNGRAPEAAAQIERAVQAILVETGAGRNTR
jgi:pimeloyl-ACP methyl ester carboxylesterase